MGKRKSLIWWIGFIVGIIAINFIAAKAHSRYDLTEEKRYSLTSTTKDLLRSLQSDITIDVFLKGDLPTEFRKLSISTQEFLTILKESNPSKVRYRLIDPQDDAGNGKS